MGDFTADSLLAKYRPDLMHLPTTNGEHCTGDGIKMGEAIGAKTIDLEWVQVHPTGLVKPDDPDAQVKFLAAEALRGVGGLVLDMGGKRFANELGRRDYVTGEMWKNKPPFRLCLNKAASDEIMWHCKHYTGRGVMKYYASGADLAKDMGVPLQTLVDTHQLHYEASQKTAADPDGGPFPAYPSGKSWDEPSGKTGSGKKFYHNVIDGAKFPTEPFYVASSRRLSTTAWEAWRPQLRANVSGMVLHCLACTWQERLLVVFMATIVSEATLFLIAWSMVVLLAGSAQLTCSARMESSRCTTSMPRTSKCPMSSSIEANVRSSLPVPNWTSNSKVGQQLVDDATCIFDSLQILCVFSSALVSCSHSG